MKEIFNKRIEDFYQINKENIIKKINNADFNLIVENNEEFSLNLINQFKTTPILVKYDKIEYSEQKKECYYYDGTPVEQKIYTFQVPFEGNEDLLSYRSNKGKYNPQTYYLKNEFIYFKSLNFDLKPISRKFSNTIDTLKSIISNLNKDYENWNITVQEYIEFNIAYRKDMLILFKKFCDENNLSEEEIGNMKFKLSALEALSHIIAEIYTGSQITILFKKAGFPEIYHDGNTKWKFLCETFENMQNESIEGFYKILKVLEVVCDPQEYLLNPELHENVLEKVNRVLGFYGFEFSEEGTLTKLKNKETKLKTKSEIKIKPQNNSKHEIFISHSSKDKAWVEKLYKKLEEKGVKTWYDDSELKIGDNLREKINEGLNECNYGIVVLSEYFIDSFWTKKEYDSLFAFMENGKLFPINHGLSKEQLESFDKSLSNIIYRDTKKFSVDEIANEICRKIRNNN